MGLGLGSRLSFMMFLQYAIWGAWLPFLYVYLANDRQFTGWEIGWMFTAGGVGAILGPFIAGQVADRWFNTERKVKLEPGSGCFSHWPSSTR